MSYQVYGRYTEKQPWFKIGKKHPTEQAAQNYMKKKKRIRLYSLSIQMKVKKV